LNALLNGPRPHLMCSSTAVARTLLVAEAGTAAEKSVHARGASAASAPTGDSSTVDTSSPTRSSSFAACSSRGRNVSDRSATWNACVSPTRAAAREKPPTQVTNDSVSVAVCASVSSRARIAASVADSTAVCSGDGAPSSACKLPSSSDHAACSSCMDSRPAHSRKLESVPASSASHPSRRYTAATERSRRSADAQSPAHRYSLAICAKMDDSTRPPPLASALPCRRSVCARDRSSKFLHAATRDGGVRRLAHATQRLRSRAESPRTLSHSRRAPPQRPSALRTPPLSAAARQSRAAAGRRTFPAPRRAARAWRRRASLRAPPTPAAGVCPRLQPRQNTSQAAPPA
jgi:hypothetical protein